MTISVVDKFNTALTSAKSIIFGQDSMLESIMCALVSEGHLLIEGMPGLGKTLSVNVMSKLCDLSFQRVQFTPDLLPSDLIGTMIFSQQKESFFTKFGPIFTQILLADEINRSPAKVQSALLEAMAEKQVTIGEETHKLSNPFVVLATQNPIDQEGTYPLPEAQLDRFMMKISIDYPDFESERSILNQKKNPLGQMSPVLTTDDILSFQEIAESVYVDEKIKQSIVRIVHATRPGNIEMVKRYEGSVLAGASPRACIWLYKVAKFNAVMAQRDYVTPDDVMKNVKDILGHRVLLTYEAQVDQIKSRDLVYEIAMNKI